MAELRVTTTANELCLIGDVTFKTARETAEQGNELLTKHMVAEKIISIDLSAIEAADSSLMSVLLSWIKLAQTANSKLQFTNIPENIIALIKLNDLGFLLDSSAKLA